MLCKIYRLRNFNVKLSKEEVEATECIADVKVDKHPGGEPIFRVTFTIDDMPSVSKDNADVRIAENGLLVGADEHGPIGRVYRQVWYCIPITEGKCSPFSYINSHLLSTGGGSYKSPVPLWVHGPGQMPPPNT
jgi:hypothetical protein